MGTRQSGVLGRVDSLGPSGPLLISEDDKTRSLQMEIYKKVALGIAQNLRILLN